MAEIIRMPRLSDTMEEGNIVEWLKKVGDKVQTGDILAEVETDKATMELESFEEGTLLYIGVEEGPVPVDGIIAIIGNEGEDIEALLKEAQSGDATPKTEEVQTEKKQEVATPATATVQQVAAPPKAIVQQPVQSDEGNGRIKASPLARSIANEANVNIANVPGTGDGGRIIKRDIESFIAQKATSAPSAPTATITETEPDIAYGDHPLSQMRKVIARRLGESKFQAPHFYLTVEIDMGTCIQARKAINEVADTKISFNDIIIKCCAAALRKHPAINSSWLGDKIRVHENINIGVAVAVKEGLLVPVINNADHKSLSYINNEVKTLATKAKTRKLQPQEMQGNTFTISNLGMFGIEEFTAIINPPDACILAVGSIIQKPVVKDGELTIGNIMKVTMSCDHRVVDGATGAKFLQTLRSFLENPVRILI